MLVAFPRKILDAAVRARRFWRRHRPRRLTGASGEANGASQRLANGENHGVRLDVHVLAELAGVRARASPVSKLFPCAGRLCCDIAKRQATDGRRSNSLFAGRPRLLALTLNRQSTSALHLVTAMSTITTSIQLGYSRRGCPDPEKRG